MTEPIVLTEENRDIIAAWYTKDIESLDSFIKELDTAYTHDYGTIVHAHAAIAVQAARLMNKQSQGGITGFQAGAVMWEFMRNWMHLEGPLKLTNFKDMLYPQNEEKFSKTLSKETWEYLQAEAKKLMSQDMKHANLMVAAHWQRIANGEVPFGYSVEVEQS